METLSYHRTKPNPRHLVLRRSQKIARFRRGLPPVPRRGLDDENNITLLAGEEVLFSFYRPSLRAGGYTILGEQDVTAGGQTKHLESTQQFQVIGPRFSLEDGDVVSTYPPQGHGDFPDILPHIVLNDPHLPWTRLGTKETDVPDPDRNSIPWLALMVFEQSELQVQDSFLPTGKEQSGTMDVELEIGDVWKMSNVITPLSQTDKTEPIDPETKAKFIFVRPELFTPLVTTYDTTTGKPISNQTVPDTSRYKYLAHVRGINTEGIPDADPVDQRLYSLVVAHRTPPLNVAKPTSMVVHLVSLENVDRFISLPIANNNYVGLVSLHSWTYSCLPPGLSLQDRMRYLGDTSDVLRVPESVLDDLGKNLPADTTLASYLKDRARDGYTLTRYRVQTGDETLAFCRSPLIPSNVPVLPNLTTTSISSADLQVLDQNLGIMDVTYSAAWQLGKTLAIADRSFAAALMRIRSQVYRDANKETKLAVMKAKAPGVFPRKGEWLKSLPDAVRELTALPFNPQPAQSPPQSPQEIMKRRWRRPAKTGLVNLSADNPELSEYFKKHARKSVHTLASTRDGSSLYNEIDEPYSTDWMVVFKWILDRLYLYNIPAHYLIPDPAILPQESLRFFSIDSNWMGALIDGALSVSNHLSQDWDVRIRDAIKEKIQEYLSKTDPALGHVPQVPTYGFLLRSDLVSQFPSLAVRAPRPDINGQQDLRAPLLRQEVISEGAMMCLFDRVPGSEEFPSLTLQLPPHQQRFTVAESITEQEFKTYYKKIFTSGAPDEPYESLGSNTWTRDDTSVPPVYDWDSRTLLFPAWAENVFDYIKTNMKPGTFTDTLPTAALCGIQLNDPMWEMSLMRPGITHPTVTAFGTQSRLLLLGDVPQSARDTSATADIEPNYTYGLWPIDEIGGEKWNGPNVQQYWVVPLNLGYPIDLVFSIVRKSTWNDKNLRKIELTVPMLGTFLQNYDGPGGKLVSNQRWNFSIVKDEADQMLIQLLPRSANGYSPVADNSEISFIWKQVRLLDVVPSNQWDYGQVEIKEYYSIDDSDVAGGAVYWKLQERSSK